MYAAEHAHFTAAFAIRPSSTNHAIGILQPRLLPSQSSYRIVREHLALAGSCSELFRALQRVLLDYHPSPALLPHLRRTPRRHCLAIGALQRILAQPPAAFHRIFLQVLHHPLPGSNYGVSTAHLHGAPPTDRRVYNATRQGHLKPGHYRVESHLPFGLLVPPPNHVC